MSKQMHKQKIDEQVLPSGELDPEEAESCAGARECVGEA
jgi:hypothetical protein